MPRWFTLGNANDFERLILSRNTVIAPLFHPRSPRPDREVGGRSRRLCRGQGEHQSRAHGHYDACDGGTAAILALKRISPDVKVIAASGLGSVDA